MYNIPTAKTKAVALRVDSNSNLVGIKRLQQIAIILNLVFFCPVLLCTFLLRTLFDARAGHKKASFLVGKGVSRERQMPFPRIINDLSYFCSNFIIMGIFSLSQFSFV